MWKYLVFVGLMLISRFSSANVVIPALAMPYFSMLVYPIAIGWVFLSEGVIYGVLSKSPTTVIVLATTVVTNIVSWVAGFLLTIILDSYVPNGYAPGVYSPQHGEYFIWLVALGIFFAYFLSILIEYYVLRLISLMIRMSSIFKMVFVANTISYAGLIVMLVLVE